MDISRIFQYFEIMNDEPNIEIYALCCPDTDAVMYIGKAKNSAKRLKAHLRERRRKYPVYLWIADLIKQGKSPALRVLETVRESGWKDAEKRLIAEYRAKGELLNIAAGGDMPDCPGEVRVANGIKSAKTRNRRIWELKLRIGHAIKNDELNEGHKQKLRLAAQKNPRLFGEYASL